MDSAEGFKDDLASVFNKLFGVVAQEEIVFKHGVALFQHLLSFAEVEFYVEAKSYCSREIT